MREQLSAARQVAAAAAAGAEQDSARERGGRSALEAAAAAEAESAWARVRALETELAEHAQRTRWDSSCVSGERSL